MQLTLSSTYTAAALGVSAVGDGLALIVAGGTARLIYSEAEMNRAMSLSLGAASAPGSGFVTGQNLAAAGVGNLDPGHAIAFQTDGTTIRAYLFDSHLGVLTSAVLGSTGQPGASQAVSSNIGNLAGVETFAMVGGATGDHTALSRWNTPGLQLFQVKADGSLALAQTIADTAKSYVANVSDTASVTLNGQDYLLALSSLENGITSYAVTNGAASLVDSLGNHDMLAVSGAAALQVMQVAGVTYAVIAATGSSSLSVVRINDMGCLFLTDHVVDDRSTRFDHTRTLDSFAANGRSFVVTGGTDAGITVMEVLPNGRLQHFATGVFESGAGMQAVTGLEVALNGTTATIYVVDAGAGEVQTITLPLASLGGLLMGDGGLTAGTAKADLIWGSAASETLQGWAEDDVIHAGGGADVLSGGQGADVFVFNAASDNARITDFALHSDRIDLSDWGRIYTAAALTVTSTATGAVIGLNGHDVTVTTGYRLTAADFLDSDFVF